MIHFGRKVVMKEKSWGNYNSNHVDVLMSKFHSKISYAYTSSIFIYNHIFKKQKCTNISII